MFTIYEEQAGLKDARHGIPEKIITDLTQTESDVSSARGGTLSDRWDILIIREDRISDICNK
jgi:hypothetical protein